MLIQDCINILPEESASRHVGSFPEFLRARETLLPGPRQEDFRTDIEHYRRARVRRNSFEEVQPLRNFPTIRSATTTQKPSTIQTLLLMTSPMMAR